MFRISNIPFRDREYRPHQLILATTRWCDWG
jgi:hypothetical protein